MGSIVRLASLTISNIKNVRNGQIQKEQKSFVKY